MTREGMYGDTSTAGAAEANRTGKREGEGAETQTSAGTGITQVSVLNLYHLLICIDNMITICSAVIKHQ